MEELLSLKWNNHRSTFLHILTILRDKQLYTDATLACEGRFYSVHRLVLSTCSDYFSAMFDRTTCKNPIIVLKDIKCEDLEALLDYMYLGEVNVRQADLASLIKAAECLRVKGLAVPDDEPQQKRGRGDTSNLRRAEGAGSPPTKRKRRDEPHDGRDDIRPNVTPTPKTAQSQSRLSPVPRTEGGLDAPSPSVGGAAQQQELGSNATTSGVEAQTPFVKVEMEDSGGDDMAAASSGDAFNINNESFKEESSEDHVGDLSNDLPEFLQQSNEGSYSHSFAGPSFQPDLPNWQGDQVLSSNSFSGVGSFPSQSQEGSQNTSGGLLLVAPWPRPAPRQMTQKEPSAVDKYIGNLGTFDWEHCDDGNFSTCPVCSQTFIGKKGQRKSNLKRHMAIHAGLKPFECELCSTKFSRKSDLKIHILNTTCVKRSGFRICSDSI